MIYVSTSCVKTQKINEAIEVLAKSGFKNIELSGGTNYYDGFESHIFELKDKYSLNYILHNYFPPPKVHFVLNLAALDNDLYQKSFDSLTKAILFSKRLGASCFGFHAGFLLDLCLSDLGNPFPEAKLFNREMGIKRFCDGFRELQKIAEGEVDLYVENNVLTASKNAADKPFMLITFEDYTALREQIEFNLLFDIGHLKISSKTLSLDFAAETKAMAGKANYFHLSENDGLKDSHQEINGKSNMLELVRPFINENTIVTLEIKGLDELRRTHDIIMRNLK